MIEVFYIRHGESEANEYINNHKWLWMVSKLMQDPPLSAKGIQETLGHTAPSVDLICCSYLLRSIQTAHIMYPDNDIHPMPWISEIGVGLENYPSYSLNTWPYTSRLRIGVAHTHGSDADIEQFESFLASFVNRHPKLRYKTDVKVAVVTHSNWMMRFLKLKQRPKNNAHVRVEIPRKL